MKRIAVVIITIYTILFATSLVNAQVSVSIAIAPPEIPVYVQPDDPYDGYIWTPGYWAYDPDDGYYWVPGVWVAPPETGFLWTPGYWGFYGGYYHWHRGYWGAHCGYYGGINYGYGYWGHGYAGGRWEGGHFRYNTAVSHVNTRIVHNTYIDRSAVHSGGSRVAFNGHGGVTARRNANEQAAAKDKHISSTSVQRSHVLAARKDPGTHFKTNNGNPGARAAVSRPMSPARTNRSATPSGVNKSTPHQNTARPQQNRQAAPNQHTTRTPQNHVAPQQNTPRAQPQHQSTPHQNTQRPQRQQVPGRQAPQQHQQAPQQHQQAPRMQAPQQHQMPQQRPQPGGGGGMGRSPQPRPQAPQAPHGPPPGNEGGGRRR